MATFRKKPESRKDIDAVLSAVGGLTGGLQGAREKNWHTEGDWAAADALPAPAQSNLSPGIWATVEDRPGNEVG